jgi:hypothetical protein
MNYAAGAILGPLVGAIAVVTIAFASWRFGRLKHVA